MPVIGQGQITRGAVKDALSDVENKLASINKKLDAMNNQSTGSVQNGNVVLYKKGKMIWWTKEENAACYRLRLFIDKNEIDIIDIERDKAYYNFNELNNSINYTVKLEIEDRNGKVIRELSIEI